MSYDIQTTTTTAGSIRKAESVVYENGRPFASGKAESSVSTYEASILSQKAARTQAREAKRERARRRDSS